MKRRRDSDELRPRRERVEVDRQDGIVVLKDEALVDEVLAAKRKAKA